MATFIGGYSMILSKDFLKELQDYVDKHLGAIKHAVKEDMCFSELYICSPILQNEMTDFINKSKKPSFNNLLFKYIDKLAMLDSEVYKKAGIDRRLFSKIRSNPDYHPSKNTAIALAFALKLDQKEADKLLAAAGYTLSDSETFDLVITFCFQRKIYDIIDINLALDYFSLKPLFA
jgi:hypothetical protein